MSDLSSRLVIELVRLTRFEKILDSLPPGSRKLERSVDFYFTILLGCEDIARIFDISKFYSSLDRTKLQHFFLPVIQEYIRPVDIVSSSRFLCIVSREKGHTALNRDLI